MKLNPYNPKVSIPCYIQFDGCEPETVDRDELYAAMHAAVITREPCITWRGEANAKKVRYEPGSEISKNVAKYLAKNGISERAKRLAEEMETCRIDSATDDLPMEFFVSMEWQKDYPPFVSIEDVVEIYPEYSGIAFGRAGCFTYHVVDARCGSHIAEFRTVNEALLKAAVEAFEYKTRCKLNLNSIF